MKININHTIGCAKPLLTAGFMIHISFAKIDFNCPHCNKEYSDSDDKYVNRCNKSKDFCTRIKCSCGNRFGMTYDIMGQAQSFKLEVK